MSGNQTYRIRIRGQVQGVGFRPFIFRLAQDYGLKGSVRNDSDGVLIEAAGEHVQAFIEAIRANAPPLSRIESIESEKAGAASTWRDFSIIPTCAGLARTNVTPDAIICAACSREIRDASERRFAYPFTNCTHCGPRFTIVTSIPYDRANTTMASFEPCGFCRTQYEDPADRRFHAQPIACPECGPALWLEIDGVVQECDAIATAASLLKAGQIFGVKGLGGFQLTCDAKNEAAVRMLRVRKRRPAKPFALMAPDLETIAQHALLSNDETVLLQSSAAPIVLLAKKGDALAPSVAPGMWAHGWMLPTTPLHLLLLDAFGGPLVMSSGNLSGEPQAIGNAEARDKLSGFADGFLMHDREIAHRLDDSVVAFANGEVRVQRRARGYTPATLDLPDDLPKKSVTAFGAELKAAICHARDGKALLSHHLGDLDDALTVEEFEKAHRDYAELFDHEAEILAADLHPDYRSSTFAARESEATGLPLIRIQHHHAHIAAVMAERGWRLADGPVLGVVMDGLGIGDDGTVWGFEFIRAGYRGYERLAHLKPVPLPGGDSAQIEPWRNLLAHLDAAGLEVEADRLLAGKPLSLLRRAIRAGINAPMSSSAGRLFDAAAALIGIAPDRQSFEGEAAMRLESLARPSMHDAAAYPFAFAGNVLDPAPLWRSMLDDLARGETGEHMVASFMNGLAQAVADIAIDLQDRHRLPAIAISGGCFQNLTFLEALIDQFGDRKLLTHSLIPPNDGSIALGQAVIALARSESMEGDIRDA